MLLLVLLAMHPLPPLPGTKINWCASLKPPQHVRSEWAAAPHGLTHLGPDSQAFDAALDTVCSKLGVCIGKPLSAPNLKLAEGLSSLGLHVEEYPRNCDSEMCSAYCNLGCRSGHKQSSEVFLQDAVRAGAHILTGVQAQQVLTASHKVRCQAHFAAVGLADFCVVVAVQHDRDIPHCFLRFRCTCCVTSAATVFFPTLMGLWRHLTALCLYTSAGSLPSALHLLCVLLTVGGWCRLTPGAPGIRKRSA